MPKNTDNQIQARIQAFVDEIGEMIRLAAIGHVHMALGGTAEAIALTRTTRRRGHPAGRKTGKAAKRAKGARKAGRGNKRVRRSSENVQELAALVQTAVRSGPGRRLGEIAAELGMDAKDIRRPAQVLVAERKLKTTGQRGGTRYFPGGGGGASSKAKKSAKRKAAKPGRKTRKGASRKATKAVATAAA